MKKETQISHRECGVERIGAEWSGVERNNGKILACFHFIAIIFPLYFFLSFFRLFFRLFH